MTKVFGNLPGGLVFLNGDEWRRNRAIISPSFTTKKFKAVNYYTRSAIITYNT